MLLLLPLRSTRFRGLLLLFAALSVLAPGAAIAAPKLIDVTNSAPVSLLHGETTPPRPSARTSVRLLADDRSRDRRHLGIGGLRVRRRLRRVLGRLIAVSTARSTGCVDRRDAEQLRAVRRRGPPSDDDHDHTHPSSPPSSPRWRWSGPRAVTPAVHPTFRSIGTTHRRRT